MFLYKKEKVETQREEYHVRTQAVIAVMQMKAKESWFSVHQKVWERHETGSPMDPLEEPGPANPWFFISNFQSIKRDKFMLFLSANIVEHFHSRPKKLIQVLEYFSQEIVTA